ncbi:hypothetical protein RIR_jg29690.t1 [Rhizophagus irregularis DAOM 181602=DAOM 197198]|nr:hypothetical protein RIR_jg29690.t1 [Rhizophagus irregularis DAOM 181602=DAOM 197198]
MVYLNKFVNDIRGFVYSLFQEASWNGLEILSFIGFMNIFHLRGIDRHSRTISLLLSGKSPSVLLSREVNEFSLYFQMKFPSGLRSREVNEFSLYFQMKFPSGLRSREEVSICLAFKGDLIYFSFSYSKVLSVSDFDSGINSFQEK